MKVDRGAREIELKVVYYGPGLAGKTTNMQYVYERVHPERRGEMFWLASGYSRTPSFVFTPVSLPSIAFGAIARTGVGVYDTLKSLATTMLDRMRGEPSLPVTAYRD